MKRSQLHLPLMATVLVLILGIAMAPSASACGSAQCWNYYPWGSTHGNCLTAGQDPEAIVVMHMGETTVTSLGGRKALVTVSGYAATEMDATCADALSAVPGLRSVDAALVINSETGRPLPESPRYLQNRLTGPDFTVQANAEGLGNNTRYFGFSAKVRRPVPNHTPLTYVFEVTLKAGISLADFAKALSTYGIVGTARANADGSLNAGHIHLRPLGLTPVTVIDLSQ